MARRGITARVPHALVIMGMVSFAPNYYKANFSAIASMPWLWIVLRLIHVLPVRATTAGAAPPRPVRTPVGPRIWDTNVTAALDLLVQIAKSKLIAALWTP
jgi:hypothetical protein